MSRANLLAIAKRRKLVGGRWTGTPAREVKEYKDMDIDLEDLSPVNFDYVSATLKPASRPIKRERSSDGEHRLSSDIHQPPPPTSLRAHDNQGGSVFPLSMTPMSGEDYPPSESTYVDEESSNSVDENEGFPSWIRYQIRGGHRIGGGTLTMETYRSVVARVVRKLGSDEDLVAAINAAEDEHGGIIKKQPANANPQQMIRNFVREFRPYIPEKYDPGAKEHTKAEKRLLMNGATSQDIQKAWALLKHIYMTYQEAALRQQKKAEELVSLLDVQPGVRSEMNECETLAATVGRRVRRICRQIADVDAIINALD